MKNEMVEAFSWQFVVEGSPDGILAFDRGFRYTIWNRAMERISGIPAERVLGRVAWEVFPFLKEQGEDAYFEAALAGEVRETGDRAFRVPESGREGYFRAEYAPVRNGEGEIIGGMAVIRDCTESRRARIEHARLLERVEFLSAASKALASSLNFEATLSTVAHLAVPTIADWCFVEALQPDGSVELLAVGHADPAMERLARETLRRYPLDLDAEYGTGKVIRTGEPALAPEIPADLIDAVAQDQEHRRILRSIGFRSLIAVPLSLHGRAIGALSLVQGESGRRFSEADLPLVQELALRAAVAIDNAGLYRAATESNALLDSLFQTAPAALGFVDRELRYRRVNDTLAEIDSRSPAEMIGRTLHEVIPDLAPTLEPMYRSVIERGEEIREREISGPRPGRPGEIGHWLTSYTPVRAPDGEVLGAGVTALDITERKRGEEAQRFLAEASAALADSLDVEETLQQLASMVVERLADGCAIDLPTADGALERVVVLSRDPRKVELVQELERRYPTPLDSPAGHTTAFRTGEPQLYTELPDELLRSASRDEHHFRLWKELEMRASISAPLLARGRTLGVITVVSHTPSRIFGPADVELVAELARRAALAIDNARLYTASQEANRAKTDFLAAMSHELRTPLNAIAGYIDLIAAGIHGPLTDSQRQALDRVRRNQEYLLTLINDVLHFAKLEAGRMEFAISEIPLSEVLEGITAVMEPQAQAREIAFAVHPGTQPLAVRADADRVRQILLNLVGNALKFTAPGGRVQLRCAADAERVLVHVQDNGRGISPDRLDAVFDPFVQLDRHRHESSQQGVGLGLAISRDLARGMEGDLLVESEPGAGSTFTLVLPRADAARRAAAS